MVQAWCFVTVFSYRLHVPRDTMHWFSTNAKCGGAPAQVSDILAIHLVSSSLGLYFGLLPEHMHDLTWLKSQFQVEFYVPLMIWWVSHCAGKASSAHVLLCNILDLRPDLRVLVYIILSIDAGFHEPSVTLSCSWSLHDATNIIRYACTSPQKL